MKKLLSLFGLTFLMAFTLTGCELYFGKSGGDDEGGGRPPGYSCESDAECAAGCYCDGAAPGKSGECAEAGFCDSNADCPEGYVCDDRSSCVPGDPPTKCTNDNDCDAGSVCNDAGVCEATCVCENDAQAQAAGFHHCDEERKTCENQNPWGTCAGEPTCGTEPQCPQGGVGEIGTDGCWTGTCVAIVTCDVTPSCNNYQHEADCFDPANGACSATYTGLNCTKPDGSSCQSGDTGCTCQSFVFATCRPNAN
ncbi:MAG: hypothetical protein M4D80_07055 [Myxococcota bacterium]|nr:hypothetical protein [Deltaproteobacteria bacterium]MDQ3334900.1 hypothetical protein [Myxococcota bacterium]